MNCIKDLYLCGGTGISLLLQHRQSEDLDFELMQPTYNVSSEEMADYFMGVIAARKK